MSVAFAFLAAAFLCAAPAAAQPSPNDQRARVLFEAGTVHYENGEYERALDQFDMAYELSPRPILLYNIALARERMGDMEGALEAFEGFLAANVEAPHINRSSLERRVQALRRRIEEHAAAQAAAIPTPTETAEASVEGSLTQQPAQGDDDGLIIGLAVGGGGGAAVIAVVVALVVVFAFPAEQPYQGTLFSERLP